MRRHAPPGQRARSAPPGQTPRGCRAAARARVNASSSPSSPARAAAAAAGSRAPRRGVWRAASSACAARPRATGPRARSIARVAASALRANAPIAMYVAVRILPRSGLFWTPSLPREQNIDVSRRRQVEVPGVGQRLATVGDALRGYEAAIDAHFVAHHA